jgi:transcriptional regulator with XRE-family HTH domain
MENVEEHKSFARIFGDNINALRRIAGVTQGDLVEKSTISRNTLSRWENHQGITLATLERVQRFFKCDSELLTSDENGAAALLKQGFFREGEGVAAYKRVRLRGHSSPYGTALVPKGIMTRHPKCFFLLASDDFMSPVLNRGDVLCVDPEARLSNHQIAYIEFVRNHKTGFRYLEIENGLAQVRAPQLETRTYQTSNLEDDVRYMGKVIWHVSQSEVEY